MLDLFCDLRRIAPTIAGRARRRGHVSQERVSIPGEQIDVPLELDSESSVRLLGARTLRRIKHLQVNSPRQHTKERRVILNRMANKNAYAHFAVILSKSSA